MRLFLLGMDVTENTTIWDLGYLREFVPVHLKKLVP